MSGPVFGLVPVPGQPGLLQVQTIPGDVIADAPAGTAIGAFLVSAVEVAALVPDFDMEPADQTPDDPADDAPGHPIRFGAIQGWILDVTARALSRLPDYTRVESVERQAHIANAGHALVVNGAASYLAAARYTEDGTQGQSTYADALWKRYEDGLKDLTDLVDRWVDSGDGITPLAGQGGPSASFPCPTFLDGVPW